MKRVLPIVAAMGWLAAASGCGGLGWYQGIGDLPGNAYSDYAFYEFCGTSSQLYQFSPRQIESSTIEALGDMGFPIAAPPEHLPSGVIAIHAHTPDGRPTDIEITPQNSLTNVRVVIGPVHVGDADLSGQLLRRISLNFGTVRRAYIPPDNTVTRRLSPSSRFVPDPVIKSAIQLEGEGLRPNEARDRPTTEEEEAAAAAAAQGSSSASTAAGIMQGTMPGALLQLNPNMPPVPYPMPPTDPDDN